MTQEGHDGQTIRTARYRYTEWTPLGRPGDILAELYDLEQDPMEYNNLDDDPTHASLITELSARLARGWQGELPPSSGN
jgi:iduronate 2-sulfatase